MGRLSLVAVTVVSLAACAPSTSWSQWDDAGASPGSDGAEGGEGEAGHATDAGFEDPDELDADIDPEKACAKEAAEATLVRTPADIILVVDNSGSMRPQIRKVQAAINADFAAILDEYKLDYRVIVISSHGSVDAVEGYAPICIEAPLSGIPVGGCAHPPPEPVHTSRFFHYSARVRKNDAGQILLGGFGKADSLGRAPNGWSEWLREEAFKSILIMADGRVQFAFDGVTYDDYNSKSLAEEMAPKLDARLRALSSAQFGEVGEERNHRFYSIVGMAANEPSSEPYPPSADLVTETCSSQAANAGLGYQALSKLTQGPRFPICNPESFDSIFRAIARDLVRGSPVACEFAIPEPPPGEKLDLGRVAVRYQPSDAEAPVLFGPVDHAGECVANAFYIDGDAVHLCPEACRLVQDDDGAQVGVLFDCEVTVR